MVAIPALCLLGRAEFVWCHVLEVNRVELADGVVARFNLYCELFNEVNEPERPVRRNYNCFSSRLVIRRRRWEAIKL
jgi:hypothetical protein